MAVGGTGAGRGGLVAHEDDVLDLPGLDQAQASALVGAGSEEAGGGRVADEEGGQDQLELVRQALLEELGVDLAAALDHEASHPRAHRSARRPGQSRSAPRQTTSAARPAARARSAPLSVV